jgi:4-hydroxy-tetrahydrodipicolinate reductase
MIRVAVNGAAGRMGRRVVALLAEQEDMQLVCALERQEHPDRGRDAGLLAGIGERGVKIDDRLSGKPQVLIDFSAPEGTVARAREASAQGVALVIGTTGLTEEQVGIIKSEAAGRVAVLVAPNMSIGMNVMFELVGRVASALGQDYDIEIVEMHHRRKKDAPSGSALKLAQCVCQAMDWKKDEVLVCGREGVTGERPRRQVAVMALRGGDVVGDHTVIFAGDGERIELTHRASSRDVFARGAIKAARAIVGMPPGFYALKDLLQLNA